MCSSLWLSSNHIAGHIGFFLSVSLNLTVLFLISEMPRKVFGSYKYLMFAFSTVGIIFSCCDFVTDPNLHITKTSFILFTILDDSGFSKFTGLISLVFSCSFYGMIMTMLAIHFLYRYVSVVRPSDIEIFAPKRFHLWALLLISNFATWFFCFYYLNGPSEMKDEELIPEFMEAYCLQPNEYTYTGPHYYYTDHSTGEWKFHIPSFIAEGYTGGTIVLTIISVAYFGHQTYQHLYKLGTMTSVNYREVQKQLFKTLVVQTIFPSIFLFFPVSCLVLFPLFGIRIGEDANLIMISFSIYPCFEPLVAICCIKSFRKRILGE
ncbi:Serpentine receptor class r-10 [Caenorhabditis elegans]|uniref:Serpentine receptor class r-10 n=1 Tax=Caenorhabditis elegans TaxID=6239 RepID=O45343_CAEEL|nr:Seven TM Receptor [Caenorhabditis elegans]CAB07348.2 Seven TM Receptor [Caenorhabditis elegans]|eukprot:NP_507073.2 Uncharacterized protein CELE_F10A3.12 [Caenorhabditis elegans]